MAASLWGLSEHEVARMAAFFDRLRKRDLGVRNDEDEEQEGEE